MKRASNKLTAARRQYAKRVPAFLQEHPICPVMMLLYKVKRKTECVHHAKSRTGALLNDERFWIAMSNEGHEEVHASPKWARANGFIVSKGYGELDLVESNKIGLVRQLCFESRTYNALIKAVMPEYQK